ncbi:RICIN domain-containing protein [Kitasatospora sp. NPDC002551]|uniref:RICIN domain-containing protein n=1 Tax=unclassified Kitasatospora TaxID=2633591 RepID=UPI00332B739C
MKPLKRAAALVASSAVLAGGMTVLAAGPASAATEITLQNVATSRYLDSNGNGNVYTLPGNGGSYQRWYANDLGGSTFTLQNKATGFCLDSNGNGNVYALSCNGGSYQKWVKRRATYGYTYQNLATGLYLDSNANGNVYTLGGNGGSYQQWK